MSGHADLEYLTLAVGAFLSWLGVPGPGEPTLIAAGVLAARGRLDLAEALTVAFGAATAGGIAGWLVGRHAGRRVLERPGPLYGWRVRTLARGEEVFDRWPAVAVLMTMSWIAGIHRVGTGTYLVWNAVGAALWSLGIGLGAYFAGPPVVHFVDASDWIPIAGVVLLVAVAVGLELRRRRGRRRW